MQRKPANRKEKYHGQVGHHFFRLLGAHQRMTMQYERLMQMQAAIRASAIPDPAKISEFNRRRRQFLESTAVRDALQQSAVAYHNYSQEPGATPIRIRKSDLERATRGYYGNPNLNEAIHALDLRRLPTAVPPAAAATVKPAAHPKRPTPSKQQLKARIASIFAELRITEAGGSLAAGPIYEHLQSIHSPAAMQQFAARINRITALMNATNREEEAVALFKRTADEIRAHRPKPSGSKRQAAEEEDDAPASAVKSKKNSTMGGRIKSAFAWFRARFPRKREASISKAERGSLISQLRPHLKEGEKGLGISIGIALSVRDNPEAPASARDEATAVLEEAQRLADGRKYRAAISFLNSRAPPLQTYVKKFES